MSLAIAGEGPRQPRDTALIKTQGLLALSAAQIIVASRPSHSANFVFVLQVYRSIWSAMSGTLSDNLLRQLKGI